MKCTWIAAFLFLAMLAMAGGGCTRIINPDEDNDNDKENRVAVDEDDQADTDGDGVPDSSDRCRHSPEDLDGFEDEDGCPDPDNDGDGVIDVRDVCPNEPGVPANSGCPVVTVERSMTPSPVTNRGLRHDGGDTEIRGGEHDQWPWFSFEYVYVASADRTAVFVYWDSRVEEGKGDNSRWTLTGQLHLLLRAPVGYRFALPFEGIVTDMLFAVDDQAVGHGLHTVSMHSGDPVGGTITYEADRKGKDAPRIESVRWQPVRVKLEQGPAGGEKPFELMVLGRRVLVDRKSLEVVHVGPQAR